MTEQTITFGNNNSLIGILTEPENFSDTKPVVFLLNAGMLPKVGPNRLHVDLARELANDGFMTLRFDFSGVGDSEVSMENHSSFNEKAKLETFKAMDLIENIYNIKSFVLFGICSGSDIAFLAAREDKRIIGVHLINGHLIEQSSMDDVYPLLAGRIQMRYYKKSLKDYRKWVKILTGKSGAINKKNIKKITGKITAIIKKRKNNVPVNNKKHNENKKDPCKPLKDLINSDINILLSYSEGSDTYDIYELLLKKEVEKIKDRPNLKIDIMMDADHVYTPVWSQKKLIENNIKWMKHYFN